MPSRISASQRSAASAVGATETSRSRSRMSITWPTYSDWSSALVWIGNESSGLWGPISMNRFGNDGIAIVR